jgi:hypothetical protein
MGNCITAGDSKSNSSKTPPQGYTEQKDTGPDVPRKITKKKTHKKTKADEKAQVRGVSEHLGQETFIKQGKGKCRDNYRFSKKNIGEGAYGEVFLCTHKTT